MIPVGVFVIKSQRHAECHCNLRFNKVETVTAFGNAVFNLQAGIDFDKIRGSVACHKKFDCAEGIIIDGFCQADGIFFQSCAKFGSNSYPRGRSDFNQFLVIALYGAVTFVTGENIAVFIRNNLNFYMADIFQIFFNK